MPRRPVLSAARLLGRAAAAFSLAAVAVAQDMPPMPPAPADPMDMAAPERGLTAPGGLRPPVRSDVSGAVASAFYRRPGAAVCPSSSMPCRPSCLPFPAPWPCGIGAADRCVGLPYRDFLYYGNDPRDDDPANRTWTTCVADQGVHGSRHTDRYARAHGAGR